MGETAYIGPYKATRLWNDVVYAFRQYMPVGRHRRYMKTFDNCFSGASATEWLLQYLRTNSNFTSDVSREKAISLLNKLYKAGIFDEVRMSKSMCHKQDVQENRLYKFVAVSPSKLKITRLPLAPRNDSGINNHHPVKVKSSQSKHVPQEEAKQEPAAVFNVQEKKHQPKLVRKISILKKEKKEKEMEEEYEESQPQCHLITRVLTTAEIKETWKTTFILRFKKVLGVTDLNDVISPDLIDGYNIMHNSIYLNKSGIVSNIEAKDQLPHWVMSAMKCLARWPEPPEPGLPSYAGFEKDVFGVVKDYFLMQEEPLVPFSLYDVITNVFVMASSCRPRHSSPLLYNSEPSDSSNLWSSASLENIILNFTKKYCLLDNTESRYGTREDLRSTSEWFGTNDHSSVNHLNSRSYNQSVFPSTDGIDWLTQNHTKVSTSVAGQSGLASQKSCPSLNTLFIPNGHSALSKTTQSASEAVANSDKWLSGISRKYGSAPDLKVSRYETAFGPDNRTVTRVFYQNGMTTDYGHDDEESSCSNGMSRVMSASCLYDENTVPQTDTSVTGRPLGRSKSFVDVKASGGNVFTAADKSTKKMNTSFSNSNLHYSCLTECRDDVCQKQNSNFFSSRLVNGKRETCFEANDKCQSICEHLQELASENDEICLDNNYCSETVPALQTSSMPGVLDEVTSDQTNKFIANQYSTYPRQAKISHMPSPSCCIINEERQNFSLARNPLSTSFEGPRYKANMHSGSPVSSLECINGKLCLSPCAFVQQPCDITPPKHLSMPILSGYGPGYRPPHKIQETGYSVILDASKKRSAVSNTDLTSLQYAPPCSRVQSTYNRALTNKTSTPYLPHGQDTVTAAGFHYTPGLSFSSITPFYSMHSNNGEKHHLTSFLSYPQTRLSEDRAKNSLQMAALLLPPANRRKLHLLFKLMMKMTSNPNLCLDPTQTTRSLVLATFYPAIIKPQEVCDVDELVPLQLVSFMLDHFDDIFTPSSALKACVSDRLKALQKPQIVYSPKPERTVRFCEQTSVTDFENQRVSTSETALENLLENIITDPNIDVKNKRKRLKQFQRTYPAIYSRRFPDSDPDVKAFPPKPKVKQPLLIKPLNKLKSLRL